MQQNTLTNQVTTKPEVATPEQVTGKSIGNVSNAVLNRLIDEVKTESQNNILAYNRTHNRHNRGR